MQREDRRMLTDELKTKLREYAARIKALLPGYTGSVTVHLPKDDRQEPKVDFRLCDVTKKNK